MSKGTIGARIFTPVRTNSGYVYKVYSYVDSKEISWKDTQYLSMDEIKSEARARLKNGQGKTQRPTVTKQQNDPARDAEIQAALEYDPTLQYSGVLDQMNTEDIRAGLYHDSRWLYENGF